MKLQNKMENAININRGNYKEDRYVSDGKAEKIVKYFIDNNKQLLKIDTYGNGGFSGFYIKHKGLSLTIYCSKNVFNSAYTLEYSVIELNNYNVVQIGGGYGSSGIDMVRHNNQAKGFYEDNGLFYTKKSIKKAIKNLINVFTEL